MRFSFSPKWKKKKSSRSSSSKAAVQACNEHDDASPALKTDICDSSASNFGSSISSRSGDDDDDADADAKFDNGMVVKTNHDSVLLEQAEESLQSALQLINEAQNSSGSWIDARDLLDRTAAALDDAGLALRKQEKSSSPSGQKSDKSDDDRSSRRSSGVRELADQVVNRRRSLLGDALVHDADGIWAKTVYGKAGDGISFDVASFGDFLPGAVHSEMKDDKALVAWSSQTGTAQKFAEQLCKTLGGNGNRCVLKSLRELTPLHIARYKRVYFVCSSFGMGRPPSNGEIFFSLLQLEAMRCKENFEDLSEGDERKPLEGTSVAIAALGSTAFSHPFKFGHGLAEELTVLGATMALDVTTVDAKNGKADQKKAFHVWADTVQEIEKERLKGWVPEKPKPSVASKAA